jgi:hypothetical protein
MNGDLDYANEQFGYARRELAVRPERIKARLTFVCEEYIKYALMFPPFASGSAEIDEGIAEIKLRVTISPSFDHTTIAAAIDAMDEEDASAIAAKILDVAELLEQATN